MRSGDVAIGWAMRRDVGIPATPFVISAFLGAGLIFLVQPMFARMATPLLGGSPSAWKHTSEQEADNHAFPSDVMAISMSPAALEPLRASGRWTPVEDDGGRPWTDGYSNVVGAMLEKARARQ